MLDRVKTHKDGLLRVVGYMGALISVAGLAYFGVQYQGVSKLPGEGQNPEVAAWRAAGCVKGQATYPDLQCEYTYAGNVINSDDGSAYHYYRIYLRATSGGQPMVRHVTYTFLVDKDGHIEDIE